MLKPLVFLITRKDARRTSAHLRLGSKGEKTANRYLRLHGFRIIETNFRSRYGEIDIIAREKDTVVFVEVKTRKTDDLGYPEESVNYHKRNKIIQSAKYYLHKHKITNTNIRFDIIAIRYTGKFKKEIKLFRDAFRIGK